MESHALIGPALPPMFKKKEDDEDSEDETTYNDDGDADAFLGPALPPGYKADSSSSEDEDVIGPMPSRGPNEDTLALDFERRARRMKEKLTGEHIGLGARTFKKRSGPENKDRSIWTDTPEDRERKAKERLEKKEKGEEEKHEAPQLTQKDLEMAEKVSKYNESKRAESLMNLHAKKMKEKAKEKANTPVERRPFDRDEDLQVNRFDEAQKQRLLKKSQELNTRFSHSKDKMFL
ncbi:Lipopolysaccharide-specific response protein 7 [Takifugu flavidus]|uniref:GPALPP motifs-containing protein 1 n=1 Tax=Takifugu flavidus TaxID=433684 RepID=A0A5C6NQD5_9TELE|nr:Lipopolysaccharide-specific response protein 7 [Takifugu flavidus]